MIDNTTPEIYKNIDRIHIIKSKEVFYPLQYVLQKRPIVFDETSVLTIKPLPEDLRYPVNSKINESGQTNAYKLGVTVTDQESHTEDQINGYYNQKVIVVLVYLNAGRCIIGCNENPLMFLPEDENGYSPAQNHGYNIEIAGNTYFAKVNL